MSKSSAIFSCTPVKNVRSSPASSRPNSGIKTRSQQATPTNTEPSPRKCRIHTEVLSSPMRATTVNVKSKLQINMSPRVTPDRIMTKPSPQTNQKSKVAMKDSKPQTPAHKVNGATGVGKTLNSRINNTVKNGTREREATTAEVPTSINVRSMRSCFEQKENKVPSKPPPSPSPSRPKSRLAESHPVTPRSTTNHSTKGILSSRSKYDRTPSFRVPGNTQTPRTPKLRRSISADNLSKSDESPRVANLIRSSSQTITPKNRVKFLDEVTPECFSPVLLESKAGEGSAESMTGEVTNLAVGVRVRPPFQGERSVVTVEENNMKVNVLGSEHCFSYDYCFDTAATQQEVFDTMVNPLVEAAFQGYHVCLFAYGQTGSGKSYSMMGEESTESHCVPENAGIIPRFSQQLFKIVEGSEEYSETKVEISYFEIYNEKIHDLLGLSQNGRSAPLRVREHPELGPYVVDLTVHNVQSFETLQNSLRVGNDHKATAATDMNMNSSRSHTIFTVTLTQLQGEDRPSLCSKINLIDLAGSERLAHTCATGDRLKEGVSINRSLLTLGKVISSLAENKKRGFIPYRESVLTWLLRESLGGNSRTAMLATISPSRQFVEETLSTLRYACQARNIVNTVRINESPHEKRIRELLEEIQRLKDEIYNKDHVECVKKFKALQEELDQTTDNLSRSNKLCSRSAAEIEELINELAKTREVKSHEDCDRKICGLQKDLLESKNLNTKYEREICDLKRNLSDAKENNICYEEQISQLEMDIHDVSRRNDGYKNDIYMLEKENYKLKKLTEELRLEMEKLDKDLAESQSINSNYERDLASMKKSVLDIKNNTSHEHCDSQMLLLQTALEEAEKFASRAREKIEVLEKKCTEINTTNHNGCEKEISALKSTIAELKKTGDHTKCDKVITNLKTALTEAEKLVNELENETKMLGEEKVSLQEEKKKTNRELHLLKDSLREVENKNTHEECEDRLNTLKKALSIAKSMNAHIQCENRISELEMELRNLHSVTLTDHSHCDEKINNLFFAIEKYADDNNKLVESHKVEIERYKETIKKLQTRILKLEEIEVDCKNTVKECNQSVSNFESQIRLLREENLKMKKKKLDDDKKMSSVEQQVSSLTKELLDTKNQLRTSQREKESSDFLCTQLQEQMIQQDRKLTESQSSHQLFDDKENWETPSKVIRRSIARHSSSKRENARCSLVVKSEEIHQALTDAEDICSRLKIPWVFHLEPEVTTRSWFDVNVRVWDQRNMSSVRWPQDVFLNWLREMKEEIMSKSRGHKLFHSSPWLQSRKDPEPLPAEPAASVQEEVESLRSQITVLTHLCEPTTTREVSAAVSALEKTLSQLSHKLGLSSPLRQTKLNF